MGLTLKELTDTSLKPFLNPAQDKLEKKIHSLLKKKIGARQIFQKIKSSPEAEPVSRFLYNAGLHKSLLNFSIKRLKNKKSIAWPYVLKLFIKYKMISKTSSAPMEKFLFHYWLKNKANHSPSLFACQEWEDISPKFQQLRFVYIQDMEKKNFSEENKLLEQLEFAQAQDLIKEEEEIIIKLLSINPKNEDYNQLKKDLEEKKVLLFIQEQKKLIDRGKREESYAPSFKSHQLKEPWLKALSLRAKTHPEQVKNLSLFLAFCDCPDQALHLLETHIKDISDYWLYLDWILETRRHTKGLELVNRLLEEFKPDSPSFLPLIYIKSHILYAMGKKSSAIEYLRAIIQTQPDYKSAQYFLDKWLT